MGVGYWERAYRPRAEMSNGQHAHQQIDQRFVDGIMVLIGEKSESDVSIPFFYCFHS